MSRVLDINLDYSDNDNTTTDSDNEADIDDHSDGSTIDWFDSQSNTVYLPTDVCHHSSRLSTDDFFGQPVIKEVVIDLETEMDISELNEWHNNELINNTTSFWKVEKSWSRAAIIECLVDGKRSPVAHNETNGEASDRLSASQESVLKLLAEMMDDNDMVSECELIIEDDELNIWLASSGENRVVILQIDCESSNTHNDLNSLGDNFE